MAPAFDNGTSLGFIIGDAQLAAYSEPARLDGFIANGHHHFGWTSGDKPSGQHIELCRTYAQAYPPTAALMRDKIDIADSQIDSLLNRCAEIPFPTVFSGERANFVAAQLKGRRDRLRDVLGD